MQGRFSKSYRVKQTKEGDITMGQRSQIYVRYNGKLILARYYQWNYSERMISRARYGIEYMKDYLDSGYDFVFRDPSYIEKMARVFDVNFDMKDVQISQNIFKEWEEYGEGISFFDYVFAGQDNNDGQLFIDIYGGDANNQPEIKYAFFDSGTDYEKIMTADEYMDWDCEHWDNAPEHNPAYDNCYLGEEEVKTCKENILAIYRMARLMTRAEVTSFLDTEDYFGMPVPF